MCPPNAVEDIPINLHNGRPVDTVRPVLESLAAGPPVSPEVLASIQPLESDWRPWWDIHLYDWPIEFSPYPTVWYDWREDPGLVVVAPSPRRMSVNKILYGVAKAFDVSQRELTGESRHHPLVIYRQAAVAIMSRLSGRSLSAIGRVFHRDHTTILYSIRKMQPLIDAVSDELGDGSSPHAWALAMRRGIGK